MGINQLGNFHKRKRDCYTCYHAAYNDIQCFNRTEVIYFAMAYTQDKISSYERPYYGAQAVKGLRKINSLIAGSLIAKRSYKGMGYSLKRGQSTSQNK